ncbi:MAG: GEVED domain-containing protein [Flavobacterium sp.]
MEKNYLSDKNAGFKFLPILFLLGLLSSYNATAQCSNYEVYESIGTAIPTSGGTWAATSMTYGTGNARTGSNNLVFDASGDIIRTPQIANPGTFSFWYRRSNNTGGTPQFTIETSPNNATWTSRGTVTPTATYQQYTLNISALGLTNVYVRIRDTRASGGAERYVDDISWTSTVAANNVVIPSLANCSQTVTCGTTYSFMDAGGINDNYNSATDYTITFTPSVGTNKVQLAFSSFSTENGYDGMVIYNGPTTASPIISSGLGAGTDATRCPAGSFYGTTSPGTISSSDVSGAITIRFRSDNATESSGWLASVTCITPCTTPTAQPTALVLTQPTNGTINGSFTAAAPAPTNYLVVYNTTGTTPSPVNGTAYTIGGTVGAGNIVADTDTNTTFSVSGLNSLTQYYFFIFSYNAGCGGGPVYLPTSPLTGNATTPFFYCVAYNTVNTTYYISGITTTGGVTNFSNTGTGFSTNGYFDYSGTYSVSQYQGSGFSITATHPSSTYGYSVWVDWNNDGDFLDAGESVISTGYLSSPASVGTITIPLATPAGNYRMRIRNAYLNNPPPACGSHDNGEAEDYTITVIALPPCATPTAQPTALNLTTVTSTSISGAFTAASPAPSGYLIVRSTSATAPSPGPISGTSYAVGSTALGAGTVIIQGSAVTSNAVSFTDTGLTSNTRYYYYIYSYNSNCTGAPSYLTTTPLANNTATCAATPGTAANSAITTSGFTVTWGAAAAGGGVGTITYTIEIYSDAGYTSPISGSPFSVGTSTTYTATGLTGGITYFYRIRASNGVCVSSAQSGSCSTLITNDNCSGAITLTVNPNPVCNTSTTATTVGATQSQVGCTGNADDDVWFKFVATGPSHTVTVTPGTLNNAVFEAFAGTCGSLGTGVCVNDTGGANIETATFIGLTTGATYFVRVYSNGNASNAGTFTICITSPPSNDECSGAISLPISTTCSYTTYSNVGATESTGMEVPGCANFLGSDIWFSAVVPATGEVDIKLQSGSLTDSGIAFYSGTCGALTLLDCNDDISLFNTMSSLEMNGLTPGQTIYIRVWGYGGATGTFGICATTPSCPSPADLYANITSATSVSVYWSASTPPAANGYQYYINTTGTAPTAGTTPTGTTAPGVVGVSLTGLTTGQKYYFWVRSSCSGSDVSTWFGPTNYSPCAIGSGFGTTTLGCVDPIAGVQGNTTADPAPVACSGSTCTNLEVSYLPLKQTTDYTVTSIPYSPPYQFTCLQNPVSVNIDDRWSPIINLPFKFCFYGNSYDKCLMGSNGVLTFNTSGANYTPGGYSGWSFTNNLPSTNLFLNTIFGVYHDIDPSKGGQVGWELITLNSGCRALVASWNEIPMYSASCNSRYYTGMIVLYENTNIIDVYIKEKNVCGTWNAGNAVVGLQNATGSAAVVAPGRNSLDTNWTVTNEAWRFTPNGPSINPTVNWYQGNALTGTLIASGTSTINVCPTTTTLYTAQVSYPLCTGTLVLTDPTTVTVTGNKIWNGSSSTDWNTAVNWTPSGVPTSANCVVIPTTSRNPIISGAPDAVGYNLSVNSTAQLTMNPNTNLTITDKVTVQPSATFTLNNSSSLIQTNNVANTGNIIYKRDSPNVRTLDYVYWSSPVAGFNVNNIVAPYTFGAIYHWNTTASNNNGGQGIWQNAAGNTMVPGKGYIARTPGAAPFNNATTNTLNGTFTGVPNNGNITIPIERGTDQNTATHYGTNGTEVTNLSDNWNLLGNPYPSAIRGSQFLFDNNTKIEGNIRLWTHGTLPSVITPSPFYGSYLSNYTPGDYLTYNFTGTSCCPTAASDLFIGAGQGFFVQMVDGPPVAAAANVTVAFNNNLRSAAYSNSTFYKMQNTTTSAASTVDITNIERNRIWLDFITPNNQTDRILFGYIEGATMGRDSFFDCITQNTGASVLYSIADGTKFGIQGRALPFDVNDEVPIGYNAPTQGNYTIGIAAVDGLFNNQNIYLKDNLLNITHDIKAQPYRFTTIAGENNDRFKIIYVENALGVPTISLNNEIKVMVDNQVTVNSGSLLMQSIVVYNILGQELDKYDNINSTNIILSNLRKNNETILLKIKLQTGETITKKVAH